MTRILRECAAPDMLDVLAERLAPTDLQSLLLEVYRRRASKVRPASLLERHESSRFSRPSPGDPVAFLEFDRLAFSLASPTFEPIELGPVCPLGTVSAMTSVDQNNVVTTSRNTEVVSDSTNVMALESAIRRRSSGAPVRLCASHRVLRAQMFSGPHSFAHFRLFALTSAGRDAGSFGFELEELTNHLRFHLRLLTAWRDAGHALTNARAAVTCFDELRIPAVGQVLDQLSEEFPSAGIAFYPERETGRGY